jgi:hypothetical protein
MGFTVAMYCSAMFFYGASANPYIPLYAAQQAHVYIHVHVDLQAHEVGYALIAEHMYALEYEHVHGLYQLVAVRPHMPGIVVALSGYGKTALQTLYVGIKLVKVKYIRLVVVYMYPLLKGQVGMVSVIAVQADYCRGAGKGVLYFLRKGALAAAAGAAYADDYHAVNSSPNYAFLSL